MSKILVGLLLLGVLGFCSVVSLKCHKLISTSSNSAHKNLTVHKGTDTCVNGTRWCVSIVNHDPKDNYIVRGCNNDLALFNGFNFSKPPCTKNGEIGTF
ncbi:hypothetical protein L596_023769 [Steinernema carpocapsae]|uniref:Uncharacterized protein n=1 Tax=Steinernema carpocapsae TaxID=34508 RepID=A0A4U5MEM5_STECR|nr:hypothetical protein L596_023769 [Steinernema carpocapsae]